MRPIPALVAVWCLVTAAAPSSWITVSYGDLLDKNAVARNGRTLKEVLSDPKQAAVAAPYTEPYSSLLPITLEMLFGPDQPPHRDLLERHPADQPSPSWAAVLRSGRIRATSDGRGSARAFLPGDDPKTAYRKYYPLLRHCLRELLLADGSPITLEVFAFRNDYRHTELRLNTSPYIVRARDFPQAKTPLDLEAMDRFFRQGGRLEGAELSPEEGLVLYASPGPGDTIAGRPVSLADLAVAYRAVFHHAGDEPYVSLDYNSDPTLATVNLGGLLQDTAMGVVLLEADKRFKTIACGLDPDTFQDVRVRTRESVPTFLTNSERAFLGNPKNLDPSWTLTRYWFYPDAITVETDPEGRWGVITRARFTADAERGRGDFDSAAEFARKRKAALSPVIRRNIQDINENYDRYVEAYPELRELDAVARLMAVCVWLKQVDTSWLNLDALLAVEAPSVKTPRDNPRMLSLEYVIHEPSATVDAAYVRDNSKVVYLTPVLDMTLEGFFRGYVNLAKYLCLREKKDLNQVHLFGKEARELYEENRANKVRELTRSDGDLLALLDYARNDIAGSLLIPPEEEVTAARDLREKLGRIEAGLARVREEREKGDPAAAAELDAEEKWLKKEQGKILEKYHGRTPSGTEPTLAVRSMSQMIGGISLSPGSFKITRKAGSPALERFTAMARQARTGPAASTGSPLTRSSVAAARRSPSATPASRTAGKTPTPKAPSKPAPPAGTPAAKKPAAPAAPPVEESVAATTREYRPRLPTAGTKVIEVAGEIAGRTGAVIKGALSADGRIVFTR